MGAQEHQAGRAYRAHSAQMQFLFYSGAMVPEEYRRDAFTTLHGSWSGYEIAG
ncbi:MAG: hypothetical protein ABI612_08855 [Betaproteobacteria bacterium]